VGHVTKVTQPNTVKAAGAAGCMAASMFGGSQTKQCDCGVGFIAPAKP
jgi:hypothetical protein